MNFLLDFLPLLQQVIVLDVPHLLREIVPLLIAVRKAKYCYIAALPKMSSVLLSCAKIIPSEIGS